MNKNRFISYSQRAAMKVKVSNHSSLFIKNIEEVTKTIDSVTKLIKAVAALIIAIAGICFIILKYYKS